MIHLQTHLEALVCSLLSMTLPGQSNRKCWYLATYRPLGSWSRMCKTTHLFVLIFFNTNVLFGVQLFYHPDTSWSFPKVPHLSKSSREIKFKAQAQIMQHYLLLLYMLLLRCYHWCIYCCKWLKCGYRVVLSTNMHYVLFVDHIICIWNLHL